METDHKTFRAKLQCGLTVTFRVHRNKSGAWRPFSVGKAERGRDHVPNMFIPFEAQNAVVNASDFASLNECERYLRSL